MTCLTGAYQQDASVPVDLFEREPRYFMGSEPQSSQQKQGGIIAAT